MKSIYDLINFQIQYCPHIDSQSSQNSYDILSQSTAETLKPKKREGRIRKDPLGLFTQEELETLDPAQYKKEYPIRYQARKRKEKKAREEIISRPKTPNTTISLKTAEVRREYLRRYYQMHKEKAKEYQRQYSLMHKKKRKEKGKSNFQMPREVLTRFNVDSFMTSPMGKTEKVLELIIRGGRDFTIGTGEIKIPFFEGPRRGTLFDGELSLRD